jgi:DNA repair protein RadC
MNYALDCLQTRLANGEADKLTEAELLALVLSNDKAADDIIRDFGGFKGMASQPLEKFLRYKGLGDATIIRLAATFEIASRIVHQVIETQHRGRLL